MMSDNRITYKYLLKGSAIELKKLKRQIASLQRLVNGNKELPESKRELLLDKLREAQKNVRWIRLMLLRNRAMMAFCNKKPRTKVSKYPLSQDEILFIFYNSFLSGKTFIYASSPKSYTLENLEAWNLET